MGAGYYLPIYVYVYLSLRWQGRGGNWEGIWEKRKEGVKVDLRWENGFDQWSIFMFFFIFYFLIGGDCTAVDVRGSKAPTREQVQGPSK